MCGLIGQLVYRDAQDRGADQATLQRLTGLAAHRGPDDEGAWSNDSCSMGFRRLAVFDQSPAGHQPMRSADGRHVIVYNGALYNFLEIRRDLETLGARFRSGGDTEVVLAALAMWGPTALERFNGMFALACYDVEARRLLLARDHAGMKPLFVLRSRHGVAFASQLNQLLQHPWGRRAPQSDAALGLYLRLGHIPAPYAFLRDAATVEPGTWWTVDVDGRHDNGRFFAFPRYQAADLHGEAAVEAVSGALEAAVRRHLRADVPVGTFLSGGIDSPLITAAAAATGTALRAFSLGTGGDALDETPDAAAYAREIGVEHIVEHLLPEQALDMIDDVTDACTEPFADYSIFPTLAVARLARAHVTVALAGDGGDELFWGYVGRFGALLSRLDSDAAAPPRALTLDRLLNGTGQGADLRWPNTIGDLHRLNHLHGSEGWLQRLFPDLPSWPADFALFTYDGRDAETTAQWLRWNELNFYLTMILHKVDRASMFHGLEARAPLLDRELIEVALRVHWRSCLDAQRRIGKLPLRAALARRIRHQTMAKRGFTIPMADWLRGPLRALLGDTVGTRTDLVGLPFHRAAFAELSARHLSGRHDYGWLLWVLLSLALWEQRHLRTALRS